MRTFWIVLGSALGTILVLFVLMLIFFPPHRGGAMALRKLATPITPQSSATIAVQYDKFHDETTVTLGNSDDDQWRMLVQADGKYIPAGSDRGGIFIIIEYLFPHPTELYRPETIEFQFTLNNSTPNLDRAGDDIVFLLDGTNRIHGRANFAGEYFTSVLVKTDDAVAISNANSVEVMVLGYPLKLTNPQLAALQTFLKTIGAG
jgi:hypothetical protein